MNEMINWNFAPPTSTSQNKGWHASAYYQPYKKGPTYTIQLHSNAPKRLLNASKVSFGLMNESIVITDTEKDVSYKVMGKSDGVSAQINAKSLVEKIANHFNVENGTNMKIRLKLIPVGSPDVSQVWQCNFTELEN